MQLSLFGREERPLRALGMKPAISTGVTAAGQFISFRPASVKVRGALWRRKFSVLSVCKARGCQQFEAGSAAILFDQNNTGVSVFRVQHSGVF